jgi:hypothetical protein
MMNNPALTGAAVRFGVALAGVLNRSVGPIALRPFRVVQTRLVTTVKQ